MFEIDILFNWDGYFGIIIFICSLVNFVVCYYFVGDYCVYECEVGYLGDEFWLIFLF